MNAALGQIDFNQFQNLMRLLPGTVTGFGVCSADHLPVWTSEQAIPKEIHLGADQHNLAGQPTAGRSNGRSWLAATMHSFGGDPVGTLVVATSGGDAAQADAHPAVDPDTSTTMLQLAASLSREFQLNSELNQMAAELGERYDELNLIYRANDYSESSEGEPALTALVRNSLEYMALQGVTLSVPGRDIELAEFASSGAGSDDEQRVQEIIHLANNQADRFDQALVLNGNGDSYNLNSGDAKVMVAPVQDGKHSISGLMVAVRLVGEDFVNSDRSLLEVVATRAARVIQNQYDALTGVLNRATFERALERGWQSCTRDAQEHCLITIDMDQMKVVNDVWEHTGGDEVIRSVGKMIRLHVRRGDLVARLGGDNFGVLLDRCPLSVGKDVAEKLRKRIGSTPITMATGEALRVTASLGVAAMTVRSPSASAVLDLAELARDDAKDRGRDRVRVFHDDATDLQARQLQMRWLARIQDALREDLFELFSQVITRTSEPTIPHHYEVLLRMKDGQGGYWSPGDFLPAADRFQLMPMIDHWVVEHTLRTLERHGRNLLGKRLSWAINLSGQSIGDEEFRLFLLQAVKNCKIPNRYLGFEVTETAAINNLAEARTFIEDIKKLGCKVYLDDFGTGVSSYEYLKALPVDYVKIDGVFIKEITEDPVAAVMVESVNQVAHAMGISTIGEFVKDEATRARLEEIGVDLAQGFSLGRPEPLVGQLELL